MPTYKPAAVTIESAWELYCKQTDEENNQEIDVWIEKLQSKSIDERISIIQATLDLHIQDLRQYRFKHLEDYEQARKQQLQELIRDCEEWLAELKKEKISLQKKNKAPILDFDSIQDAFEDNDSFEKGLQALRTAELIDEGNAVVKATTHWKGGFVLWLKVLQARRRLKKEINLSDDKHIKIIVDLMNQYFKGLQLGADGRNFRNIFITNKNHKASVKFLRVFEANIKTLA